MHLRQMLSLLGQQHLTLELLGQRKKKKASKGGEEEEEEGWTCSGGGGKQLSVPMLPSAGGTEEVSADGQSLVRPALL